MVTTFRATMLAALVGLIALGPSLGWSDAAAPESLVPGSFPGDLPSATLDGATYSVRMNASVGLGDEPVALVTITNPGDQPLDVDSELHVYASESSPMSRVPVVQRRLLVKKALNTQLAAGETKTLWVELGKQLTTVDPKALKNAGPMMMMGAANPFPRYAVAVVKKGQQLPNQIVGGRIMLAPAPNSDMAQAPKQAKPAQPAAPGYVLARFAIDPAKLVRFTQTVERDTAGKATGVVVVAENLTDLPMRHVMASVAGGEGYVALVEGAPDDQLAASGVVTAATLPVLKPHAKHTFRWAISKPLPSLQLVTNFMGAFFGNEAIALAPAKPAPAAQTAQAAR